MSKISLPILLAFLTVNAYGQNNYKNSSPAYGSENRIAWEKSEIPVNSEFTLKLVWLYNPLNESMYVGEDKKGLFNSRNEGRSWIRIDCTSSARMGHFGFQVKRQSEPMLIGLV